MWDVNQKTLNSEVNFSGIGLHSGETVDVTLVPSNSNSGIIFKRSDIDKNNEILAILKMFHLLNFVQKYKMSLELVFLP